MHLQSPVPYFSFLLGFLELFFCSGGEHMFFVRFFFSFLFFFFELNCRSTENAKLLVSLCQNSELCRIGL